MNEETQVSQAEPVAETTVETQPEKTEDKSKELESALAQKAHYREKLEKEAEARKKLEAELEKYKKSGTNPALDVEDYIDISASLDGLDQREKERLAREHKLTGRPLKDIRKDEDFQLWQAAYRAKVEKEQLALKPTGAQADAERPKTLMEKLSNATFEEKERMLAESGLWRSPRPKADRRTIG